MKKLLIILSLILCFGFIKAQTPIAQPYNFLQYVWVQKYLKVVDSLQSLNKISGKYIWGVDSIKSKQLGLFRRTTFPAASSGTLINYQDTPTWKSGSTWIRLGSGGGMPTSDSISNKNFRLTKSSNVFSYFEAANNTLGNVKMGVDPSGNAFIRNSKNTRLDLFTNDYAKLTILGNGDVGIGTIMPTNPLVVQRDQNDQTCINLINAVPGAYARELMVVGINTTAHNMGFGYANAGYTPVGSFELISQPNSAFIYANTSAYSMYMVAGGASSDVVFGAGGMATSNERMRIKYTGLIGIGTDNPASKLHIDGGNATNTYSQFTAGTTTGQLVSDGFHVGIGGDAVVRFIQLENHSLKFYTNGLNLAVNIDSLQNVGIGTNTPAYKLDIGSGGTGTTPIYTRINSGSGTGANSILILSRNSESLGVNGISGSANAIITGSVVNDYCIASKQRLLFSSDNGTTANMTIANTGNVQISGDLKYAFKHAIGSADSIAYTSSGSTKGIYYKINTGSFTWREQVGITCAGDSAQILTAGEYKIHIWIAVASGATSDKLRIRLYVNNNQSPTSMGRFTIQSSTAANADTRYYMWYRTCAANDWLSWRIANLDAARATVTQDIKIYIEKLPE